MGQSDARLNCQTLPPYFLSCHPLNVNGDPCYKTGPIQESLHHVATRKGLLGGDDTSSMYDGNNNTITSDLSAYQVYSSLTRLVVAFSSWFFLWILFWRWRLKHWEVMSCILQRHFSLQHLHVFPIILWSDPFAYNILRIVYLGPDWGLKQQYVE